MKRECLRKRVQDFHLIPLFSKMIIRVASVDEIAYVPQKPELYEVVVLCLNDCRTCMIYCLFSRVKMLAMRRTVPNLRSFGGWGEYGFRNFGNA